MTLHPRRERRRRGRQRAWRRRAGRRRARRRQHVVALVWAEPKRPSTLLCDCGPHAGARLGPDLGAAPRLSGVSQHRPPRCFGRCGRPGQLAPTCTTAVDCCHGGEAVAGVAPCAPRSSVRPVGAITHVQPRRGSPSSVRGAVVRADRSPHRCRRRVDRRSRETPARCQLGAVVLARF